MLNSVFGFKSIRFAVLLALVGALSACATPPLSDPEARAAYEEANDPFEPANRLVFSVNVMVDQLVLQPVAVTYRDLVPDGVKQLVRNFFTNLFMPVSSIHALLQGDLVRAGQAAERFVTAVPTLLLANTMPEEEPVFEDAGQTMAVWGFGAGPYVMLPILGPSSVRGTVGTIADFFIDPVSFLLGRDASIGRAVGNAVETRSRNLDQVRDLQKNSIDYYAAVRSLYRQQREDQVRNGASEPMQPAPTIALDLDDLGTGSKETASGN